MNNEMQKLDLSKRCKFLAAAKHNKSTSSRGEIASLRKAIYLLVFFLFASV